MTEIRNIRFFWTFPLLIIVFIVSFPAYAKYSGGIGEPNNPYQIATADDLILLGESPEDYNKHFILTADIDLDPNLPGRRIFDKAIITSFTGIFDGKGHNISNLTIMGTHYVGLFGQLKSRGVVRDLGVVHVDIIGSGYNVGGLVSWNDEGSVIHCYSTGTVNGNDYVGGLVGWNDEGSVIHCYSTGTVNGNDYVGGLIGYKYMGTVSYSYSASTTSGNNYIGGLVGRNAENVTNCYNTGTVSGIKFVGGLVGQNYGGTMSNNYSMGAVSGNENVGGLVGHNYGGTMSNNYSMGAISGNENVGGLVGHNYGGTVSNSYSTSVVECSTNSEFVGGLIGYGGSYATGCFWDTQTSGQTTSYGGTGLTTIEMKNIQTYQDAGWDFAGEPKDGTSETWLMPKEDSYPVFAIWNGYAPFPLRGTGTPNNPYLISNILELGALCYYSPYAHYRLDNSIDLSGIHWSTSVVTYFKGIFDGNDHIVSHLSITGGGSLGLFGCLELGAKVTNLGVVDVNIIGSDRLIGGLVGKCSGDVNHCYSTGLIACSADSYLVGGLVGLNYGTIKNCYSMSTIWGHDSVGGLVGSNSYQGVIEKCYSTGSISGGDGCSDLGGLVGGNSNASISNCYAVSRVTCGNDSYNVGGFVGENLYASISHCWSTGEVFGGDQCLIFGGLVGRAYGGNISKCFSAVSVSADNQSDFLGGLVGQNNGGSVSHCFWDIEASGLRTSEGGFGRTTSAMKTATTYVGWGGTQWTISERLDYPHLVWENRGGVTIENIPQRTYNGRGKQQNPFILADGADLYCLMARSEDWSSHFELVNDIDMTAVESYLPIGNFSGILDGQSYRILNLNITENSGPLGLIGYLRSGFIRNVGLVNVTIAGAGGNIGSLAGINGYDGTILSCYSTGTVSGANGSRLIGGLVGNNFNGSISYCYSAARVSGGDESPFVGGLAGGNDGTISDCYSTGRVSSGVKCFDVGGLVGMNLWGTITNCYSIGGVSGGISSRQIGGFAGSNLFLITRCFWDSEASGVPLSNGGSGKATVEMQTASTFLEAGWDFIDEVANGTEDIWWILEGQDYPRLWWELSD